MTTCPGSSITPLYSSSWHKISFFYSHCYFFFRDTPVAASFNLSPEITPAAHPSARKFTSLTAAAVQSVCDRLVCQEQVSFGWSRLLSYVRRNWNHFKSKIQLWSVSRTHADRAETRLVANWCLEIKNHPRFVIRLGLLSFLWSICSLCVTHLFCSYCTHFKRCYFLSSAHGSWLWAESIGSKCCCLNT